MVQGRFTQSPDVRRGTDVVLPRSGRMQEDAAEPGYKHIIFRPQPVDGLEYVTYSNLTPYGKAGIHWENKNNGFTMDITVPVGSHATVYVPAKDQESIHERGNRFVEDKGMKFLADGRRVCCFYGREWFLFI